MKLALRKKILKTFARIIKASVLPYQKYEYLFAAVHLDLTGYGA